MATVDATEIKRYMAANMRRLRARRGLTQEGLADAAGLDLTTVQRIERAEMACSIVVLARVAAALDVKPGLLLRKAQLGPITRGRPKAKKRTSSTRGTK
jgi:transcriptional regulator with XRE-family HTH domain